MIYSLSHAAADYQSISQLWHHLHRLYYTIPKWNVQLLVGIQSHLFPFQQENDDTDTEEVIHSEIIASLSAVSLQELNIPYQVQRAQKSEAHKQQKATEVAAWNEAQSHPENVQIKADDVHIWKSRIASQTCQGHWNPFSACVAKWKAFNWCITVSCWGWWLCDSIWRARSLRMDKGLCITPRPSCNYSLLSDPDIAVELWVYVPEQVGNGSVKIEQVHKEQACPTGSWQVFVQYCWKWNALRPQKIHGCPVIPLYTS